MCGVSDLLMTVESGVRLVAGIGDGGVLWRVVGSSSVYVEGDECVIDDGRVKLCNTVYGGTSGVCFSHVEINGNVYGRSSHEAVIVGLGIGAAGYLKRIIDGVDLSEVVLCIGVGTDGGWCGGVQSANSDGSDLVFIGMKGLKGAVRLSY
jgi:hypothetical protein